MKHISWVFDSLILPNKLNAKDFWRFPTCLLVNNNLCGKLVSSLELSLMFDDSLRITSVLFFVADFNY